MEQEKTNIEVFPSVTGEHLRFISDVHLGHPKSIIKHPEELRFLLKDCRKLIVCGDLCEMRECVYQEKGAEQLRAFQQMCASADVELVHLSGNHDPDAEPSLASFCNGRVLALHGHCLFKETAPWGREYLYHKKKSKQLISKYQHTKTSLKETLRLAREMSKLVPPVIRNKKKARSVVDLLMHIVWPPSRPIRIISAWLTMTRRIHSFTERFFPEAFCVIYGHLHRREIVRRHGRVYINLGAYFQAAKPYVVDILHNEVTVYDISGLTMGRIVKQFTLPDSQK